MWPEAITKAEADQLSAATNWDSDGRRGVDEMD